MFDECLLLESELFRLQEHAYMQVFCVQKWLGESRATTRTGWPLLSE